ncbi:MAG: hypothetical protein J6R47_05660 [Acholeplasmatales bacterium]|nr:hypothetical protein [Acholeplasmatales bacterium]
MKFKLVEDWDRKYDPPYNAEQIKANYGEELYNKLIQDPAHKWRMETGIELIHKEPTKKELDRIWNNWQLMTPKQKSLSDEKSLELFGLSNKENYDNLLSLYEDWDRLEEGNGLTKAFSDRTLNNRTSNNSGSNILDTKLLKDLNLVKLTGNQHYVLHHRDGNHNNKAKGNEYIMSNTDHGRIHTLVRKELQQRYFNNKGADDLLNYQSHINQIEALISSLRKVCSELGIKDTIIFEAPDLSDTDILIKYKEIINPENEELQEINCEIFDAFYTKYRTKGKYNRIVLYERST